jgi:putative hemolysin
MRWTFLSSLCAVLAGCAQETPSAAPTLGMANPASVYCATRGGRSEIVTTPEGQHGLCHLPDGTVIDEWALWRRDHPQGS